VQPPITAAYGTRGEKKQGKRARGLPISATPKRGIGGTRIA